MKNLRIVFILVLVSLVLVSSTNRVINLKFDLNTGVTIEACSWLEDDANENSDLIGNVVIDNNDSTIEISNDTYNTIEHGENSDLTGDVYIDPIDIINN